MYNSGSPRNGFGQRRRGRGGRRGGVCGKRQGPVYSGRCHQHGIGGRHGIPDDATLVADGPPRRISFSFFPASPPECRWRGQRPDPPVANAAGRAPRSPRVLGEASLLQQHRLCICPPSPSPKGLQAPSALSLSSTPATRHTLISTTLQIPWSIPCSSTIACAIPCSSTISCAIPCTCTIASTLPPPPTPPPLSHPQPPPPPSPPPSQP